MVPVSGKDWASETGAGFPHAHEGGSASRMWAVEEGDAEELPRAENLATGGYFFSRRAALDLATRAALAALASCSAA
jgi:hypothetical protein